MYTAIKLPQFHNGEDFVDIFEFCMCCPGLCVQCVILFSFGDVELGEIFGMAGKRSKHLTYLLSCLSCQNFVGPTVLCCVSFSCVQSVSSFCS